MWGRVGDMSRKGVVALVSRTVHIAVNAHIYAVVVLFFETER